MSQRATVESSKLEPPVFSAQASTFSQLEKKTRTARNITGTSTLSCLILAVRTIRTLRGVSIPCVKNMQQLRMESSAPRLSGLEWWPLSLHDKAVFVT